MQNITNILYKSIWWAFTAQVERIIFSKSNTFSNLFFVSVKWKTNNAGIKLLPNSLLSGNVKATGWSWQLSLCLRLSTKRLFCLCCNPSKRHPWGRMKDFSPDPNSQKDPERQNNSKATEKPLITVFFLKVYGYAVCHAAGEQLQPVISSA